MGLAIIVGVIAGFFALLASIAVGTVRLTREGVEQARRSTSDRRCLAWIPNDDGVYQRCGKLLIGRQVCDRPRYSWVTEHVDELPEGAPTGDEWHYADDWPTGPRIWWGGIGKATLGIVGGLVFLAFLLGVYVIAPLMSR